MRLFARAAALLLGSTAALFAVSAEAAHWGKPGLWQTTATMEMAMGGMPKISPQQMAQMKKMGIPIPGAGPQVVEAKMCVTPADAENFGSEHYAHGKSGCKQASVMRNGGHIVATVVCTGQMNGTGKADVTLIDDKHYSTVYTFKGTSRGRPVDMKVSTKANWLGGDCGHVRPFQHG